MTVISYPIPAYSNVPIQPQNYAPRRFVISNITLGHTTKVTTVLDMDYVVGQLVRLIIPSPYGTSQLNYSQSYVLSIPALNEVILDISSIGMNAFVAATFPIQPQILAIGDINTGTINSSGRRNNITFIPGSFINISPQPQ